MGIYLQEIQIKISHDCTKFTTAVDFINYCTKIFCEVIQIPIWVPIDYTTEQIGVANILYFNPQGLGWPIFCTSIHRASKLCRWLSKH